MLRILQLFGQREKVKPTSVDPSQFDPKLLTHPCELNFSVIVGFQGHKHDLTG